MRTRCRALGARSVITVDVAVRVRRDGRFSSAFADVDALGLSTSPVTLGGRRRTVFDVTKFSLSGRFTSRRRVGGSWRLESAVYDLGGYPSNATPLDRCDSGSVRFGARLRRRR